MIVFSEKKLKKQKILLILFGGTILVIIFLVYFNFFYQPITKPLLFKVKKINIDFMIFEEEIFQNLKPFLEISPSEESFGRENPFLPYQIILEK